MFRVGCDFTFQIKKINVTDRFIIHNSSIIETISKNKDEKELCTATGGYIGCPVA